MDSTSPRKQPAFAPPETSPTPPPDEAAAREAEADIGADVFETPVDFFILGPRRDPEEVAIWAVYARLLAWVTQTHGTEDSWTSRAMRNLFVGRHAPPDLPLLPGTMIARCGIFTARVTVNGVSFDYLAPRHSP